MYAWGDCSVQKPLVLPHICLQLLVFFCQVVFERSLGQARWLPAGARPGGLLWLIFQATAYKFLTCYFLRSNQSLCISVCGGVGTYALVCVRVRAGAVWRGNLLAV